MIPPLSNDEAWNRLPPASKGQGSELPVWAKQLAAHLPRTTAALLNLDLAHRKKSPIPADARAGMRIISAIHNGSPYAEGCATLDFSRAISGKAEPASSINQTAEFARQMTVNSAALTDEQFAALVREFGQQIAASMVLLMAYANFQDRLFNCLGIAEEFEMEAAEVEFAPEVLVANTTPPAPRTPTNASEPSPSQTEKSPGWSDVSYETLQTKLEAQRQRPTRLPIPEWSQCAKNLPAGLISRPSDIVWYRIVFGYAPELAVPFEYFMRTSAAETSGKWDRVFGTSLFWVTTRAVECPYCMGHCEMNFEVAGLTPAEIAARSRILASDDWSSFPPREQRAFEFARKLSLHPGEVGSQDVAALQQDFGEEAGLIIALSASRYHYMTRISNGFQLTLERENLFYDYYGLKRE